jgi:hemoglobin
MSRLVLDFYDRVLASDRLAPFFAEADMRRLVEHQAKFIASVTGGPASYPNEVLADIHAHLAVDDASFDEMVRIMGETLIAFDLDSADQEEILDAIRARRGYIVTAVEA